MEKVCNKEEKLLQEAKDIINKDYETKKNSGGDFNIFSVLNIERDEVFTHSNMIYSFLSSESSHFMEDKYLKLFLEVVLGVSVNDLAKKWYVEREWPFQDGRIDFVIYNDESYLAIEMKIDAMDQPNQLKRYEHYAKAQYKNYKVFYLTPEGRKPTCQSIEGMESETFLISFKDHIMDWLQSCINITPVHYKVCDALKQYKELVYKITNSQGLENKMAAILMNKENYMAFRELQKAENVMKKDFMIKFCSELEKRSQQNNTTLKNVIDENLKMCKPEDFFNNSANVIYYEIDSSKEFTINGVKYNAVLAIEISNSSNKSDGSLVYGYKLKSSIDSKYLDFSKAVINDDEKQKLKESFKLQECGAKEILTGTWLYWDYIYSEDKGIYTFRDFNNNAIKMLDGQEFEKEVDRIYNMIISRL